MLGAVSGRFVGAEMLAGELVIEVGVKEEFFVEVGVAF